MTQLTYDQQYYIDNKQAFITKANKRKEENLEEHIAYQKLYHQKKYMKQHNLTEKQYYHQRLMKNMVANHIKQLKLKAHKRNLTKTKITDKRLYCHLCGTQTRIATYFNKHILTLKHLKNEEKHNIKYESLPVNKRNHKNKKEIIKRKKYEHTKQYKPLNRHCDICNQTFHRHNALNIHKTSINHCYNVLMNVD